MIRILALFDTAYLLAKVSLIMFYYGHFSSCYPRVLEFPSGQVAPYLHWAELIAAYGSLLATTALMYEYGKEIMRN